jgi:hypothetical protein
MHLQAYVIILNQIGIRNKDKIFPGLIGLNHAPIYLCAIKLIDLYNLIFTKINFTLTLSL